MCGFATTAKNELVWCVKEEREGASVSNVVREVLRNGSSTIRPTFV